MAENGNESLSSMKEASPEEQQAAEAGHQQGQADTQVETENLNGLKQTQQDGKGEDVPKEEAAKLPEPSETPSQLPQGSGELFGDKESEAGDADKTQDTPIAFGLNDAELRKAIWKSTGAPIPPLSKEATEGSESKENVEPNAGQGLLRGNRMPCSGVVGSVSCSDIRAARTDNSTTSNQWTSDRQTDRQ